MPASAASNPSSNPFRLLSFTILLTLAVVSVQAEQAVPEASSKASQHGLEVLQQLNVAMEGLVARVSPAVVQDTVHSMKPAVGERPLWSVASGPSVPA